MAMQRFCTLPSWQGQAPSCRAFAFLDKSAIPAVMQIDNLPPLREVIAAHDLRAKKELGQNFLLDLNLTSRIARVAGPLDAATVIEVGPGPGGLTRALLAEGARKVIAIERDERTLPALAQIAEAYPGRDRKSVV